MMCPTCKGDGNCEKNEMNTFLDYADYLYSVLCVKSVELSKGNLGEKEIRELEILEKCCKTVQQYAWNFDRRAWDLLDIPKKDAQ